MFVRRVGEKCLSRFTKHSCRISQNIQTNRKRGETMSRFWSNVHSLFPELDWKWVQRWVQEQGREDFFCVIHTPSAKAETSILLYQDWTPFQKDAMKWKMAKWFSPYLVGVRETERDRKGEKDIFLSLHHHPSLFWEACSPFCMINNIICTWPRLPAGCMPLCSRQGWVARAWCGTEASPSGVTRGLPNPRWACAGICSNEGDAFMLISTQKQGIRGWWGCLSPTGAAHEPGVLTSICLHCWT